MGRAMLSSNRSTAVKRHEITNFILFFPKQHKKDLNLFGCIDMHFYSDSLHSKHIISASIFTYKMSRQGQNKLPLENHVSFNKRLINMHRSTTFLTATILIYYLRSICQPQMVSVSSNSKCICYCSINQTNQQISNRMHSQLLRRLSAISICISILCSKSSSDQCNRFGDSESITLIGNVTKLTLLYLSATDNNIGTDELDRNTQFLEEWLEKNSWTPNSWKKNREQRKNSKKQAPNLSQRKL